MIARPAVVEASIAELRAALESGRATSVGLVAAYLERIAAYDRHGPALNAVPVLNPDAFAEARASDERRARGETLGPLDGIPYTAKDSYLVRGLTAAAGSPAFERLVAQRDAFTIERLRAAGAICLGLTNMPPMANGGMQRGLYGRAESPYSQAFLPSAFGSGSSNGSGTATAASFGAFGLGEETWSSGRAPASCSALVAYTPSRGVISTRGNWPLVPTMDVVVPHARSMADLLELLDVVVADDAETRGDFWRAQPWIELPAASAVRPASYLALAAADGERLDGRRLGVPRMYVNADPDAREPIETHPDVIALWEATREALEALGAEVVEVDFPVVSNMDLDRPGAQSMAERGLVADDYEEREIFELSPWAWDDFLCANGDPALDRLERVDGGRIFPQPPSALPDAYGDFDADIADYVEIARAGLPPLAEMAWLEAGLRGLERTRELDLEAWMRELRLDAVVFPAVADIGPADADANPESARLAWRNGTWVANGNLAIRLLGIPTVTVPMGPMASTGMPVGLTIAGAAYDDEALLQLGVAVEAAVRGRTVPERTPELEQVDRADADERAATDMRDERDGAPEEVASPDQASAPLALRIDARVHARRVEPGIAGGPSSPGARTIDAVEPGVVVTVDLSAEGTSRRPIASVDGAPLALERATTRGGRPVWRGTHEVPAGEHERIHSTWRGSYGSLVVATVRSDDGAAEVGAIASAGGIM